ncbi:hypothetical protein [Aestuariibacter sp. A3R04]|uniref:hypothetical protein n=1 Tax=Aestuariibacter sp. A3R04 TaxID=2841571 RepID=UPI001C09A4DA|nr:hypothetical protein [Aestuariibacter sp. A3R04]MBU3020497.1 hypothetical protein [Aestuariibacter sp. A3R04]
MWRVIGIVLLFVLSQGSRAAPMPSLVVIGAGGEEGSIASSAPIYRRVTTAIVDQMRGRGFSSYAASELLGSSEASRQGYRDSDLTALVRTIQHQPVDIMVEFAIHLYLEENRSKTANAVRARIAGRLIYINTGESLGAFETQASEYWMVPLDCVDVCLSESVGEYSRWLADELGAVLAEILDDEVSRPNFTFKHQVNLVHFSETEKQQFAEQLVNHKNVVGLRNYKALGFILSSRFGRDIIADTLRDIATNWSQGLIVEQTGNVLTVSVPANKKETEPKALDIESIFQ